MDELPFAPEQADLVYDGRKNHARGWVYDLAVEDEERPVIAYTRLPSEDGSSLSLRPLGRRSNGETPSFVPAANGFRKPGPARVNPSRIIPAASRWIRRIPRRFIFPAGEWRP